MVNHHRWTDMNSSDCNWVGHLCAIIHGLKMAGPLALESVLLVKHSAAEPKKHNLKIFGKREKNE